MFSLFGCHRIGHIISLEIPTNAYCISCQFLTLTLSFLFPNGMKWWHHFISTPLRENQDAGIPGRLIFGKDAQAPSAPATSGRWRIFFHRCRRVGTKTLDMLSLEWRSTRGRRASGSAFLQFISDAAFNYIPVQVWKHQAVLSFSKKCKHQAVSVSTGKHWQ